MEVIHEDQSEVYENFLDVTGRDDALKSSSGEDSKVPAAAPGVKLYRLAALSFGLLCFLQAALNISLRLALSAETRYKNLTEERDELERKLNASVSQAKSLTEERDTLKRFISSAETRYKNLTEERDELKRKLNASGWIYFSNSLYYISSIKKTWQDSRNDCLQKGADLMMINSEEEQNFTRKLKDNVWIGLTDIETEETWKWVDGTPLTTSYWGSDEPNGNTRENCGEIKSHKMENNWNDGSCDNLNFWLCEMKISV